MKKRVTYCNEQDLRKMDEIIDGLGGIAQGTNMRGDVTVALPKSPRTKSPQYTTTYDQLCEAIESDNKKSQRLIYVIDNKEASCVNDTNKCCKSCNVKPKFYDSRNPSANPKSFKAEITSAAERSPQKRSRSSVRSRNSKFSSKVPQSDFDEKSGPKHLTSDARSTKAIIPKGEEISCKVEENNRRSFGLASDAKNTKTVEQKFDDSVYKTRDSITPYDLRSANTASEENTRKNGLTSDMRSSKIAELLSEENYMTRRGSTCYGNDLRFAKAVEPNYQGNDKNPGCLTDDLRGTKMVEPLCEDNCCLRRNVPYGEGNERIKVAETICEEKCNPSKNSTSLASDMRSIKTTEKICEENYNPNRSATCAVNDMRTMKAVEPSYDPHSNPRNAGCSPQLVYDLEFDENGRRRPTNSSDLTRNSRYTSYKNNDEELKMKKLCSKFRNNDENISGSGCELDRKSVKNRTSDTLNSCPCPSTATNQSKRKRKNISKRSLNDGNAKTQLKLLKLTRGTNDRMLEETLYLKDIQSDTSLESIIMNVNIEALQHKKALSDIVDLVRDSSLPQIDRQVYYFQTNCPKPKCHKTGDGEDEKTFMNGRTCRSTNKEMVANLDDDSSPLYKCPSGKKAAHYTVDSHPPPCVYKNMSYQKHTKEISRESSPEAEDSYDKIKNESSSKKIGIQSSLKSSQNNSKRPQSKHVSPTTKDGHPTAKDEHPRTTGLHHTKFQDNSKKHLSPSQQPKIGSHKTNKSRKDDDDDDDYDSEKPSNKSSKKLPDNSKGYQLQKQDAKNSDHDSDALTERSERSKTSRRRYSKNVAEPFEIPPENNPDVLSEDNDRKRQRTKEKGERNDQKRRNPKHGANNSDYDSDELTDHSDRSKSSRHKLSPNRGQTMKKGERKQSKERKVGGASSDSDRSGRQKKPKNSEDVVIRKRTEDDDGKCFENRIYILLPGSKRKDKLLNSNQGSCAKCKCGHSSDSGGSEYSSTNTAKSSVKSSGKPRRKVERFHHVVHSIPDIKLNEIQNYLSDPKNFAQATFGVPREVNAPRIVKQGPTKLKGVFHSESIKLGDVCDGKERPKTPKLPSRAEVEQLELKVKGILTNSGGAADPMSKNHEIKIPDDVWRSLNAKSPNHSRASKTPNKSPTRIATKSPIKNRVKSPPKTPAKSPIRNLPIKIHPPVFSTTSSSDEYNAKPSMMFGNKPPKFNKPIKPELCHIQNTLNEIPTKIPVSIQNHSLARMRTLSQPRRAIKPLPLPKHDSRSTPTLRPGSGWELPPSDRIMYLSRPKPNMKRV